VLEIAGGWMGRVCQAADRALFLGSSSTILRLVGSASASNTSHR
jgi:hypothetical protein